MAGCAYQGPAGTLLTQRLTWLSYLDGADIRAACGSRFEERYRLVYNARFEEQARGYDIVPTDDGGALMRQTVDRGVVLFATDGAGSPIRPTQATTYLPPETFAELRTRLAESGAFGPTPVGLRLSSRSVYWLILGCHGGRPFMTGFRHPSSAFERLTFDELIRRLDTTGVRFREPRPAAPPEGRAGDRCPPLGEERRVCFTVELGRDGLVGP